MKYIPSRVAAAGVVVNGVGVGSGIWLYVWNVGTEHWQPLGETNSQSGTEHWTGNSSSPVSEAHWGWLTHSKVSPRDYVLLSKVTMWLILWHPMWLREVFIWFPFTVYNRQLGVGGWWWILTKVQIWKEALFSNIFWAFFEFAEVN